MGPKARPNDSDSMGILRQRNSGVFAPNYGNTTDIPSAAVMIQYDGAGPFNALTNVSPFNAAASGLQLGPAIAIKGYNKNSSRTDTLADSIDTTIVPQLQADTYIGTLNIQAQVVP